MLTKQLKFSFLFLILQLGLFAQQEYWVLFTDKNNVSFDPYTYFDQKAIQRRIDLGISLYDSTDFPLNQNYVSAVNSQVVSSDVQLRWFNALSVVATIDQIQQLKKMSFVAEIIPLEISTYLTSSAQTTETEYAYDDYVLFRQIDIMQGSRFIENKIDGKGVRIAIFDAGFPGYKMHPAFDHIRKDNRILNTWNFAKKHENVDEGNSHGTATFSCVGGMYEGKNVGLATGAEFLLAITEVNSEPFKEEKWWMQAVEWADKNGANIISSSLGYGYQRYFPEQMDGHHSLVAEAARMATRKGILVVNSAGNEGTKKSWKTIITPSDVDSVLCVAGIFPDENYHTSFSSYGPAADGKMKPNVTACAHVWAATPKNYGITQGTSFSCPLTAGFAACAWQTHRNWTNMELFKQLENSSNMFPYFDYAHGYGVPQAGYFLNPEPIDKIKTFEIQATEDSIKITVDEKYLSHNTLGSDLLYYNIQLENGVLESYEVIAVFQKDALQIERQMKGKKLNVYFKGYSQSFQF